MQQLQLEVTELRTRHANLEYTLNISLDFADEIVDLSEVCLRVSVSVCTICVPVSLSLCLRLSVCVCLSACPQTVSSPRQRRHGTL